VSQISRRSFLEGLAVSAAATLLPTGRVFRDLSNGSRPNVLWILVDDISPNLSCFGETLIATPNLDQLASEGTRFTRAYVSGPICSPSRTGMLTGMYQTSMGGHHHRSGNQNNNGFSVVNLPAAVRTVPELFKAAGFYTSHMGKTDENFARSGLWDKAYKPPALPRKPDYRQLWAGRGGKPFFAQMSLMGPKNKKVAGPNPVDPDDVVLPPYYANDPALRNNWAQYLNSIERTDYEVKDALDALRADNLFNNTIIVFAGDNGIAHLRGKQFLTEDGTQTPLIIRGPGVPANQIKPELVSLIDIGPTCLALAGIAVPAAMQGRALFGAGHVPRDLVFTARDRADETIDRIRAVEGPRYKYIRNYYSHKSHMQPNEYKDGLPVTKRTRKLLKEGRLNADQRRIFDPTRPIEELYDLQTDPFELNNLALAASPPAILQTYRQSLNSWIVDSGDLGAFPEPVYFRLSAENNSTPLNILGSAAARALHADIEALWKLGQNGVGNLPALLAALNNAHYGLRYTGAYWIGVLGAQGQLSAAQKTTARNALQPLLNGGEDLVRMAAARAIGLAGYPADGIDVLRGLLTNQNETIRLYTLMALEDMLDAGLRPAVLPLRPQIAARKNDAYRYAASVAVRLDKKLSG